jgi:hypothetical protein
VRRIIAVMLIVAACGGDVPDLADTLGPVPEELDQVVGELHRWLDTTRESRSNLFETLSLLETTAAAGDLYDRVSRLREPGLEADLGRYTRFTGDLLLASGDLDKGIADDNLQWVALAWLRIEAGAGALAVGLEPQWCPETTPAIVSDLCRPIGVAREYDAAVEHAVRLFLARYRPLVRLPAAFGDGVRGYLAMTLAPEVVATIDDALAELGAVTPPDALHAALQQSFVDHLGALRVIWEAVPRSLEVEDPPVVVVIGELAVVARPGVVDITAVDAGIDLASVWPATAARLTTAVCDGAEEFAAARTPLRAALPQSTLPALGSLWFYGEGTGCP